MTDPIAGAIRQKIEAQGFRRLADDLDALTQDADAAPGRTKSPIVPIWLSPLVNHTARRMLTALLRAEATRLDPKGGK